MGLFSKLFGGKDAGTSGGAASPLRSYFDENLPKSYTQSKKYAVHIQEEAGKAAARITLDMLADGSDYKGFGEEDYWNLAEMESGYLLTGCVAEPPVPTDFTLELVFGGGRTVTVTKKAGVNTGTLSCGGKSREISF